MSKDQIPDFKYQILDFKYQTPQCFWSSYILLRYIWKC